MPALLDQLRDNEQQTRGDALRMYRQLLARRHEPQDGDADRLRDVMNTIGLTPADFQADASALSQAAGLDRQILSPDALAKLKADHAAAVEKWQADAKQLMKDAIDALLPHQLDHALSIVVMGSPLAGGSKREAALREQWGAISSGFACATGSQDFYKQQAAALRAKNPRAFA